MASLSLVVVLASIAVMPAVQSQVRPDAAFETVYETRAEAEQALMNAMGVTEIFGWDHTSPDGSVARYDYGGMVRYFRSEAGFGPFPTDFASNEWWTFLGVLPVVPMADIESGLDSNAGNLAAAVKGNDGLYEQIHGGLENIPSSMRAASPVVRSDVYSRLKALVDRHPAVFGPTTLDVSQTNRVVMIRLSMRGAMLAALTGSPENPAYNSENLTRLAGDLKLTGLHHTILSSHGVIVEDNHMLSNEQLEFFDLGFASRDRSTWQIAMLSTRDNMEGEEEVTANYGKIFGANNTFNSPLSRMENTSPYNYEFGLEESKTPQFHIAFAHEIDHNSADSRRTDMYRTHGEYYDQRKYELLRRSVAWSNDVKFGSTGRLAKDATKAAFKGAGLWDGSDGSWQEAWNAYWTPERQEHYPRNNMGFFLDAPQEAFASLGNLWYTDSYRFLELGKNRYDRALHNNINQFLHYVDYSSRNRGWMFFVTSGSDGTLEFRRVDVIRNDVNHVTGLDFGNGVTASFPVDGNGWVTGSFSVPGYAEMLGASAAVDPRTATPPPPPPTTTTTTTTTVTTQPSTTPTQPATTTAPSTTENPTSTLVVVTTLRPSTTQPSSTVVESTTTLGGVTDEFTVRARGFTGDERLDVEVSGTAVASIELTMAMADYAVDLPAGTQLTDVKVAFVNDAYREGYDRNVQVDYVIHDGRRYETEAESTFVTGSFRGNRCDSGRLRTDTLHCAGHFSYGSGDVVMDGTLTVRARGYTGDERIDILVDGNSVGSVDVSTEFADYQVATPTGTAIQDIQVVFVNDAMKGSYDRNLQVDYVVYNGVAYESEAASTFASGPYRDGRCASGNLATDVLHCGGYFSYGER